MSGSPVRLDWEEPALVVTIDHPPVNAISLAVIEGVEAALAEASRRTGCRAVVLTGAGTRSFSAGADLGEVASDGERLRRAGLGLTTAMEECALPVIAALNGPALGGGCELALACDLRIASSTARLGQPEVRLGLIPGWGGTQRLGRLIGRATALPLLLTGEALEAPRAQELGLVWRVVEPGELIPSALDVARGLARGAPLAQAAIKRALHRGLDRPLAEGLEVEASELAALRETGDAAEGVLAFLERRDPRWGDA